MMRRRTVSPWDARDPMTRLLQDGALPPDTKGVMIAVNYAAQWRTLAKAMRLGYVDSNQYLTDAGRAYLAKQSA